jgi:CSLREA domain-containing protein
MLVRKSLRGSVGVLLVALALGLGRPLPAAADSTIAVNSTADTATAGDGQCTLREAILNANADADTTGGDCTAGSGADTIGFNVSGTIALASALPDIAGDLTLSGPGAGQLTISGNGSMRVLRVLSNAVQLFLNSLTIANGSAGQGAGIFNRGILRISDSAFVGNIATQAGGAIFNQGAYMTVTNTTFSGNNGGTFGGGIDDQPDEPVSVILLSVRKVSNNIARQDG